MIQDLRHDFKLISNLIEGKSRVLDIGCSNGELLEWLVSDREVTGRGIEIDSNLVRECIGKGLSVIQGDADTDLQYYADKSFDYVILSHTLQATREPHKVLQNLVRIAKYAIVSFANFGHYDIISQLFFSSRMPVSKRMPYEWYETPNIHFFTLRDLIELCSLLDINIHEIIRLNINGKVIAKVMPSVVHNLFCTQAIVSISEGRS